MDVVNCGDGCGRVIPLARWDIDGPETQQPDGFRCIGCDVYTALECGDRRARRCDMCKAYNRAQDVAKHAKEMELLAMAGDHKRALEKLKWLVALESDLGRRLRLLEARKRIEPTEAA